MKTAEDEEFERIEREQKIREGKHMHVEIEFKEWVHPKLGVVKAEMEGGLPLVLKARIKQEWVSLTDEDIFGIFGTYRGDADYNHDQLLLDARRIESKIKGLNT